MKKILKNNVKVLVAFIVGILCSGITVCAAYKYVASEVSYSSSDKNWNVNSVEEALNELHNQFKDSENGYGVRRKLDAISSSWERIGASEGLQANAQVGTVPVRNDFDSIYPWSDIISYNYDTGTKQVTAYYGDSNFTFTPTENVEVLTKIPEFYYRRYQDDTYEYIYISKEAKEGYSKSEEFSIGRYTMSGNATRVHSRSGVVPLVSTTITNFRTYARNLGEEFGQLDYHYFLIQLLYLVEYADYNSQMKLGPGYTNSSKKIHITSGGCDSLGMHSGSVDGTFNTSIIYRGIEDIFGNVFQFIDGINVKENQPYICYDKKEYQSGKFDGCYTPLGYLYPNVNSAGEWISKVGYDVLQPLIALPIEVKGNDYTNMCDVCSTGFIGEKIGTVISGDWYGGGTRAGIFNFMAGRPNNHTDANIGARLIKTN